MNHAFADLRRNLLAGLRLALFMRVSRLVFRIDRVQLVLLFVASVVLDIATDWIRAGPDPQFSLLGSGGEFFTLGVLVLAAALQAILFRQRALALAVPVLALAAYPVIQLVHTIPFAGRAGEAWLGSDALEVFEIAIAVWSAAVLVRAVAVALFPARPWHFVRALLGGMMIAVPIALAPMLTPTSAWWHAQGAPIDGRYPNPASEPVLA